MSEGKREIEIIQAPAFWKVFKRLREEDKDLVDAQVARIEADPEIGELKKGELNYLRVHKFKMHNAQVLLGYSWQDERLQLYLLNLGPHENFYREVKSRRKAEMRIMGKE